MVFIIPEGVFPGTKVSLYPCAIGTESVCADQTISEVLSAVNGALHSRLLAEERIWAGDGIHYLYVSILFRRLQCIFALSHKSLSFIHLTSSFGMAERR